MTNYQHIKEMNKKEMIQFIKDLTENQYDNQIDKWFTAKYCDKCTTTEVVWGNEKQYWHECDFEGKCSYQSSNEDVIRLWLDSEMK